MTIYLKRFVGSLLEASSPLLYDPARLLDQLNQELLRERLGKHIALWIGVLDLDNDSLLYANAGAVPYPLLQVGGTARELEQPSPPAGLLAQAHYHNQSLDFPPGARLLLQSDGVGEALDSPTPEALRARVASALAASPPDAAALAQRLGLDLPDERNDDCSLLLLIREDGA